MARYAFPMAEPLNILIIEDDPSINEIVAAHLERAGHRCIQAYSGSEGLLQFSAEAPDLVITDLMLPGTCGEDVVQKVREQAPHLPLIVISARITPADKVALLKLGADDYLTKPFDLEELSARIEVQLRHRHATRDGQPSDLSHFDLRDNQRGGQSPSLFQPSPQGDKSDGWSSHPPGAPLLRYREWTLDPESYEFTAAGTALALTRTEFGILALLMGRPTKVFTKQELFELVWGEPYAVDDSTINVHVSNLRRKLKPTGTDDYLQTVWGLGYKLA